MIKSITDCLRQWLLKGAVVIKAGRVTFENCTFTITGGTGLSFEDGEITIHGDLTAINEAVGGWCAALQVSDQATAEVSGKIDVNKCE